MGAGAGFWKRAVAWGLERNLLSPKEAGILTAVATAIERGRSPFEKQAATALEVLARLREEGFGGVLPGR